VSAGGILNEISENFHPQGSGCFLIERINWEKQKWSIRHRFGYSELSLLGKPGDLVLLDFSLG
jgi:hypothetical protein